MSSPLAALIALPASELERLAGLFEAARLSMPPSALSLTREGFDRAQTLADELRGLAEQYFTAAQVSVLLRGLAESHQQSPALDNLVEIVVSGPDAAATSRDTAVVVDELFAGARQTVLVVGFALHDGRAVLRRLAQRLDADPALEATLCLDISRGPGDSSRDEDVIARFAERFVTNEWPGERLPKLYFDPRALAPWNAKRAVLHAKSIVIDGAQVLVTSANLTTAAQTRNIELGLLVRAPTVAAAVQRHFELLIRKGILVPVSLPQAAG